jgi:hypothetical protein
MGAFARALNVLFLSLSLLGIEGELQMFHSAIWYRSLSSMVAKAARFEFMWSPTRANVG